MMAMIPSEVPEHCAVFEESGSHLIDKERCFFFTCACKCAHSGKELYNSSQKGQMVFIYPHEDCIAARERMKQEDRACCWEDYYASKAREEIRVSEAAELANILRFKLKG